MSKFIKGFIFVLVLVGVLFFSWHYINEKKPVEITPEKLIETMQAEKIETHRVISEATPIFKKVDSLARLEFYKMHAVATEKNVVQTDVNASKTTSNATYLFH